MFSHKKINQDIEEIKKVLTAMAELSQINDQDSQINRLKIFTSSIESLKVHIALAERIDAIQNHLGIEFDEETKTMKKKETKKCNSKISQKKR